MMHAYALELTELSVEKEALIRTDFNCSDSKTGTYLVLELISIFAECLIFLKILRAPLCVYPASGIYLCFRKIQHWSFRRPEFR